ncbi:MAG: M16 family metallopeptidase [Candidatus Hodarchaeales archaeon]
MSKTAMGSQYTPKGLYDPEYYVLDNGMRVILKERDISHNVALRLSVNVGFIDFPCGQKELPHFLEHLLFTGTSKHSEAELEVLIKENGGWWNAETDFEETVYKIDIYSPNVLFALDIFYEILTDSQIAPEKVELSRDIIHREAGGKPSDFRQWLYRHGIGREAINNAFLEMFRGTDVYCPDMQTAEGITREDIMSAYHQYYVPNNMLLAVVGEFNRDDIVKKIEKTFGTLETKPLKRHTRSIPEHFKSGPTEFTGSFSPVVDSNALIAFLFRTDGDLSEDLHSLIILENYLQTRLYEILRIDNGLSYSPASFNINWDSYGLFGFKTDVDIDNIDLAKDLLRSETKALKNGAIDLGNLNNTKQEILLSWAQGFESNSDFADYYVSHDHELKEYGAFINHEDRVESITLKDIGHVVSQYLNEDRMVIIKKRPTFTYTQLYSIIGFLILAAIFIGWRISLKVRRR